MVSNAAPIFNNFVCTASFFGYAALVNSHPDLAILCLAIGNPLGVAVASTDAGAGLAKARYSHSSLCGPV